MRETKISITSFKKNKLLFITTVNIYMFLCYLYKQEDRKNVRLWPPTVLGQVQMEADHANCRNSSWKHHLAQAAQFQRG